MISRRRKKIRIRPNKQPEKCKGCVWGRWDGVKQFCSWPECPKEEKPSWLSNDVGQEGKL